MREPPGTFFNNPKYSHTKHFLRASAQTFKYCASINMFSKTFFNNKIVYQMRVPSGTFFQNPEYSLTKNFLRPSAQIFNYCASMHYVFKNIFLITK